MNAARADALLARMNSLEELASACEAEAVPGIRNRLAERYRKLIGVGPHLRGALRAELATILESGHRSLRDVVEGVHQSNRGADGSASPLAD